MYFKSGFISKCYVLTKLPNLQTNKKSLQLKHFFGHMNKVCFLFKYFYFNILCLDRPAVYFKHLFNTTVLHYNCLYNFVVAQSPNIFIFIGWQQHNFG